MKSFIDGMTTSKYTQIMTRHSFSLICRHLHCALVLFTQPTYIHGYPIYNVIIYTVTLQIQICYIHRYTIYVYIDFIYTCISIHRYHICTDILHTQISYIHRYSTYTDILHTQIFYMHRYAMYTDILYIYTLYTQISYIHRYHICTDILCTQISYMHRYPTYTDILYTQISYIHRYPTYTDIIHTQISYMHCYCIYTAIYLCSHQLFQIVSLDLSSSDIQLFVFLFDVHYLPGIWDIISVYLA